VVQPSTSILDTKVGFKMDQKAFDVHSLDLIGFEILTLPNVLVLFLLQNVSSSQGKPQLAASLP
jgi:hypothetical protein